MRVLMVTPELPYESSPGTMAPVARQIESIRATGIEVEVLEIKGVKGFKYVQCWPQLWRLSRAADLIHAHYGYCGLLARAQLGTPIVVSFMGDDLLGTPDDTGAATAASRLAVRAHRWLARTVEAVIVKSEEMGAVVAPALSNVIPNGVDLERFKPLDGNAARSALGLNPWRYHVLFPGNPNNPRKGFDLARQTVQSAAAELGQLPEILTLNGVDADRVPLYMNASDAMVMTSLWEGSPNVVKEAMACNLPIVSVVVGDVTERLRGVSGSSICPRDPAALGSALAQTLKRRQRGDGRQALLRDGLDQSSVAQQVATIYDEVIARRRQMRAQRTPSQTSQAVR